MTRRVYLAPSLLSANFTRLADDVRRMEEGGADFLHVDVMDGHFVPNITIGPPVVQALKGITKLPLDCHLMISDPDRYVEAFAAAGAAWITVHVEAAVHLHRTVQRIRSLGVHPGVTLNPATSLSAIEEILPDVEMVLLMSVEPGFGGQSLIPSLFRRARTLRRMLDDAGNGACLIEADGGIKLENVREVYEAGVDVIVSGSGVFGTPDPVTTLRRMRELCT
ncbi:MAG TPA: ribulose-phosphate 3-epimerase [Candidatus Kapabacteria bacterium]|nr:ribulose-phosphate 3-epimerase [Candidatus Kapabacteria bacterium]